ncbi:MAG: tRNA (N6-isopentenyl adenosine(37)-C2)-methylthiotransferase MiaB [Acholeplasmataceae bacterium]|nr:tRNA (N6-isopentenyl adenosine(37)-C2)-methylthiotransferase MiaB [Paracholeplasma brassicae]
MKGVEEKTSYKHMVDIDKYFKPDLKKARKRSQTEAEILSFEMDDRAKKLGIGKKYKIQTYGCQGNEADSETMAGILENMGYVATQDELEADVILLNTCAIRENAENRIWGELGRLKPLKRRNPDLLLGLCGCMAQEEKVVNRILEKYDQVDLVFGTHNLHKLQEYILFAYFNKERVIEVYSEEGNIVENLPKSRFNGYKAFVNIMFGCDEFCTYCIVPYTRGKERSRAKEDIIKEVTDLYNEGYQEVTLLGQNVNAYGKDRNNGEYTLGDLLVELDKVGIPRIRFTTSHPHDLDQKTIDAFKNCKSVMPHLHLPVQSGSNSVLKKMNRHYTKEMYLEVINRLKIAVPDIALTTDIIVGFPTESNEDFLETLDLVKQVDFEGAYTFIFSKRAGTPAAKFEDNIPEEEKKNRLQALNKVVNEGYARASKKYADKVVKVLVDGTSKADDNTLAGYSEHNKLVNFKGDKSLIGKIVDVKITETRTWFLIGEACE